MKNIKRLLNNTEKAALDQRMAALRSSLQIRLNWKALLILIAIGLASGVHIRYYDASNWSIISKFLICIVPVGFWIVIEDYFKQKKNGSAELFALAKISKSGQISVLPLRINRIAKLEEHEDEGDLYLIENESGKCLWLWDAECLLVEDASFPGAQIEIYLDEPFRNVMGKKVKCSGEKRTPVVVDGSKKWAYFGKVGFPGDLQLEKMGFDEVIRAISDIGN